MLSSQDHPRPPLAQDRGETHGTILNQDDKSDPYSLRGESLGSCLIDLNEK
jgi:hypothetical protein